MKSLLLSDLYNVSTIGKRLLSAVSIISISFLIGFGGGNFLTYTTCMCGIMVVNLFSMDERSNWIKYAMIMPTTKREYVYAKYIMAIGFVAGGFLISFLIYLIASLLSVVEKMAEADLKVYSITALSVGLLFISLYVPALIKVGVEKARVLVLLIIGAFTALCFIVYNNQQKAPNWLIQFGENIGHALDRNVYIMLLFMLVLLAISLLFSVRWMEKKEI